MSVQNVKNNKPYIIGLTGGIATGKSTVSYYLKEKGLLIIDSDLIVRDLWQHDEKMQKQIVDAFNLDETLELKGQVRKIVFNNEEKLKKLNEIVHPRVFEIIDDLISKNQDEEIIIIDMPLLFEVGYQNYCDLTCLVYLPQHIQIKRLMERDQVTRSIALKIIHSQMPMKDKKKLADVVLDNRFELADLYELVDLFIEGVKNEK